jgi:hypothetical protein
MASNHVMRVIPKPGTRGGYLYLALRCGHVQVQLKTRATGSVVDGLDPVTVGDVVVPNPCRSVTEHLADQVDAAWEKIAGSQASLESISSQLEGVIVSAYERSTSAGGGTEVRFSGERTPAQLPSVKIYP